MWFNRVELYGGPLDGGEISDKDMVRYFRKAIQKEEVPWFNLDGHWYRPIDVVGTKLKCEYRGSNDLPSDMEG